MLSLEWRGALGRGIVNSARVNYEMAKFVVPAVILVVFLERTGALAPLGHAAAPLMRWFGLPGEASLALLLGNLGSPYSGIAALAALALTPRQITIAAAMLATCHSMILESGIAARAGANPWPLAGARVAAAAAAGGLLNLLL